MEKLNSYMGMADNDFAFAKAGIETGIQLGNFNGTAAIAAQAAEKYLKAILELGFSDDASLIDLLHSHNLRALYNKIITKYELRVNSRDCKWLGDFYFDARYPGDNFVVVNRQDADECLMLTEKIAEDARRIISEEKTFRMTEKEKMKNLKAF